jgi:hypothetical protein
MHNELRYHAKKHEISEKLLKEKIKFLHLLPQIIFYYLFLFQKMAKTCMKVKNQNLNQACVVRSNMSSRREVQITKTEKQLPCMLFLSAPNSTCRSFSRQHEEKMGRKQLLFLDCKAKKEYVREKTM